MLDALIILGYFVAIMIVAVRARLKKSATAEEYFICGRSLRWYSIAASTIATNLHAGHFLAVVGSAYAFGLAQANFELNAIFGLLMAAFVFVPLYLRAGVVTITQYFEKRFGKAVSLSYSGLTMLLYGPLYLGGTLFWGGYALQILFGQQIHALIGGNAAVHICTMIVLLGVFSAVYTWFGGLGAVVKTDMIQFLLLLGGGLTVAGLALHAVGGFSELQRTAGDKLHLHLPNSHQQLPWLGILAMNLLNLQYWGCNQVILQRSLAARSLRDAQIGLLAGGFFKFITAGMLVLPGIALIGILGPDGQLTDPDEAYLRIVELLLKPGIKGLVLCGLFASLMSSVDSIFNSISTLWSIDFYRRLIRPDATDQQVVAMGKKSIIVTLAVGVIFGFVFTYIKLDNPEFPLDPFFKKTSYFIKNGFVVLVAAAVFLYRPPRRLVLWGLVATIPVTVAVHGFFSDTPYLILTSVVIIASFLIVAVPTWILGGGGIADPPLVRIESRWTGALGVMLAVLLVLTHIVLH